MMKTPCMLKLQALVLLCGLFMISCSEDNPEDDINPSAPNSIAYDGKTYEIKNGLILHYGSNESHFNNDIILSDGTFSVEETENGSFALYLELYSAGTTGFKTGTFQFVEDQDEVAASESKSFFTGNSGLIIETNGDGVVDDSDEVINIIAGTVTISGSGTEYTIAYDVTLENGKTLQGSYAGSFQSIDRTEEDEDEESEEPVAPASFFRLDDQRYDLTQGVAHSVSVWEYDSTGRYHEILLMGDGFQIDDEGNYTGEGIWLNLTLVAREAGQIEGEYKVYADFGAEDDARNAPDFTWKGLEVLNGDPESEDNYTEVFDSDRDETEMTVKITKTSSGEYEITVSGTDNGRNVELQYTGHLPVHL